MSKAKQIVLEIMKERGLSDSQVSEILGEIRQLHRQRMKVSNDLKAEKFFEIIEALGYEVEIKDKHIMTVDPEFMERLKNPRSLWHGGIPKGLFYTPTKNGFDVVDTRNGDVKEMIFMSRADMEKWVDVVSQSHHVKKSEKKMA